MITTIDLASWSNKIDDAARSVLPDELLRAIDSYRASERQCKPNDPGKREIDFPFIHIPVTDEEIIFVETLINQLPTALLLEVFRSAYSYYDEYGSPNGELIEQIVKDLAKKQGISLYTSGVTDAHILTKVEMAHVYQYVVNPHFKE